MTTQALIDRVRRYTTTGSDYAVAQLLGISPDAVHLYRKGKRFLSPTVALKVADVLGMPPSQTIAIAEAERAGRPEDRALWKRRQRNLKRRTRRAS